MIWIVLGLLGVGLVIAVPATRLMIAIGHRAGALDSPGVSGHDKSLRDVPNTGGFAIFLALALPLAVGLVLLGTLSADRWTAWGLPVVAGHLQAVRGSLGTGWALLGGLTIMCVVGLVDDRRPLGPWFKLGVQVGVAFVLVWWFEVRLLELLGPWASITVTIVWIVVVTNAINFLDNMDGLAGGVSAIAATLFMAACLVNGQWFIAATLALLIGGLIGFLVFNFPPARVFMGDGGSLLVGFTLAVLTARTTFYDPAWVGVALGDGWYGVFMPLVVLAVPLYDLTSVVLIRLAQGRNPMVGDQQHFSHRLVQRGLSTRGATVVIWIATAVSGIGGISLGRLEGWQAILVGLQTLLILALFAMLEYASRHAADVRPPT